MKKLVCKNSTFLKATRYQPLEGGLKIIWRISWAQKNTIEYLYVLGQGGHVNPESYAVTNVHFLLTLMKYICQNLHQMLEVIDGTN
jgi:hypothetical protein